MIRKGDVIKHTLFKHVCFEVSNAMYSNRSVLLDGYWINQGFINPRYIGGKPVTIEIEAANLKDWLKAEEKSPKSFRNTTWRSV